MAVINMANEDDHVCKLVYSMVSVVHKKKRIILNILPESKRHELKFSLKIEFSFLAIILNWQVPN